MNRKVREEDFFSKTPPQRIIGTEMEYTVDSHMFGSYSVWAQAMYGMQRDFLPNGARLYRDLDNVEYCSAESLGPLDAAASDHAGIPMIHDMYGRTESQIDAPMTHLQKFVPLRRAGGFCSTRDSTTGDVSKGYATMGYHENLLTVISPEPEHYQAFEKLLASFLATRHIWAGAGMVLHDGTLELSQKLYDVYDKELMRMRVESEKIGRLQKASILEVRTADVHMLPYASYMGLADTSLVLRLVEQGYIGPQNISSWAIKEPYATAERLSTMSYDDFDAEVTLENGEELSVVAYQRRLAELAYGLSEEITLPEDEVAAAKTWLKLMQSIEASGLEDPYLLGRVEYVTKHALMHYIAKRKGKELDAMQKVAIDLSFTKVDQRLARSALTLFGDQAVKRDSAAINDRAEHYKSHTPRTRARARGKLIKIHGEHVNHVDWNYVTVNWHPIVLKDPYDASLRTVSSRTER